MAAPFERIEPKQDRHHVRFLATRRCMRASGVRRITSRRISKDVTLSLEGVTRRLPPLQGSTDTVRKDSKVSNVCCLDRRKKGSALGGWLGCSRGRLDLEWRSSDDLCILSSSTSGDSVTGDFKFCRHLGIVEGVTVWVTQEERYRSWDCDVGAQSADFVQFTVAGRTLSARMAHGGR